MKFTLSWLKEHLDTDANLDEITAKLTAIGLEVEAVEDRAAELKDFTVCRVVEAAPHPDADRLRVCTVDTGAETVQVVCGAPNARTGMKGVFARSGLTVPGTGLLLKPTKIRGVDSNGMLVSEREMGLSDEHTGIIELPEDAVVGQPFAPVMGLDDPMIEIAITPNRQDCLGVNGIARDLAAAGLGRLMAPDLTGPEGKYQSPVGVRLAFEDPETADACPVYHGCHVRGVKNGPSPKWLQERLLAIGLRPISTLVDITNFVTFDLGRPLHVFDADKVKGDIQVRLGRPGESFMALDGETYEMTGEECVIADDGGAHGFGGVMGGEANGVTAETVNVFIESAWFDPVRTARTGRRHSIDSDARYRFERGVDPESVAWGIRVAARLVTELCGGEPSEIVTAGEIPDTGRTVTLRASRVASLGGVEVDEAECRRILEALGFGVSGSGEAIRVAVPSWRRDIDGEADLVEEVVRIHGYDHIRSAQLPPVSDVARPSLTPGQRNVRTARRVLAGRGMVEAVTWSFLPRAHAALFGGGQDALVLSNPISADLDCMRPSLLANLIAAAGRNADRGAPDTALFEVGPQYRGDGPDEQDTVAGGVRRGQIGARHWAGGPRPADAFDAKADALAALTALGVDAEKAQIAAEAPGWYHPGRSGVIRLGPKLVLAHFGEIHPAVLDALDVKGPLVGFEVFVERAPLPKAGRKTTRPPLKISDYPAVSRDFAFIVDRSVAVAEMIRAARGADRNLIEDVQVFDVYEGASIGEGRKSIALAVKLQPTDRTLTDEEIEQVAGKIVANVTKSTGGVLRG
ncbi:phenylalanine--tRNA ligase subunit beta [Minwuia thermotolerans]|uniref:Phenylalanine--tRNA ligase beta subunit n=1 Tax=Minwuia thermotolerans TaxID=2056226 RepID=A0A2M9G7G2_9PROT|nr:phenylalanine--tRNA ligase subunit beta [Minwuia thermotolerans]PJK31644.1 phenylalanine--tRNA ligase subunit beta [Minwuia thermotolerans]